MYREYDYLNSKETETGKERKRKKEREKERERESKREREQIELNLVQLFRSQQYIQHKQCNEINLICGVCISSLR